jgi:glycogen operon protein
MAGRGVVVTAVHTWSAADLRPGRPWPLGAQWDGTGVNFAVFSEHAQALEVCLFDEAGAQELTRLPLQRSGNDGIWHGYLPGAAPGLVYALRAHGAWQPPQGQRFNPHKLLLDPYARGIVGRMAWCDELLDHRRGEPEVMDTRDSARQALKARVLADGDEGFDWGDDRPPVTPLRDTVLYELHVKGFSQLNLQLPEELRGRFAGLAHPASVAHFKRLGVTALCLLPVHFHVDEERLAAQGLSNYWGYNTLGFFCPHPRFGMGDGAQAAHEFRAMVKALHAAGLEVILDVVYNHTAEGDQQGPALSFKGLDNASYYRRPAHAPGGYDNFSGCGNTLDLRQPAVLRLVLDSLRHWVQHMRVDGFRFDLAPVLGRGTEGFQRQHAFFTALAQDPVLGRAKLIAEPWDVGPGGYQLGQFPRGWLEWNDRFRDALRGFWLARSHTAGELAQRLCGSAELFAQRGRLPAESVNYVTSHDGFTLRDLVSYNQRHNEANGEHNRDGHGHNLSWNCGVEGDSDNPQVLALRARLQRALLACTVLAQGTPMLAMGSELGNSQGGNNNAYCHDHELNWLDWAHADLELQAFTGHVLAVRRQYRPLGTDWYTGEQPQGDAGNAAWPDLAWLRRDGRPLAGEDWHQPDARVLGCRIQRPGRGHAAQLLLVHGGDEAVDFQLPPGAWRAVLDSSSSDGRSAWRGAGQFALAPSAVALLIHDVESPGHGLGT